MRSLGPAANVRSGAEADLFAVRAATLMTVFIALSVVVGRLGLDSRVAQVLAFAPMLAAVPWILQKRPSMADVGLTTRSFGRDVLLGLWAFLLELPVTGAIAILGTLLLRNLPRPEHPAATTLQNTHDFWTIVVTLFMGAIVAPFWEETMFRGLLFPALRRVLRGPVIAALISSFLFASIHPQGPVLWAALASVALFSCALAQMTRSLVPSVVMHFAHNATLLVLAVLASS
ncbi:CPBP family intramembrane metalloprotease [bacterium]|nr:MAG: CPBP family intramembrane metalloprotease [bacterium]